MYVPRIRLCKLIAQACFRPPNTVMNMRVAASTYHDLCCRCCECARRMNLRTFTWNMCICTPERGNCSMHVLYIQFSEPIALHVVPIRSRTRSQSWLRGCVHVFMCYAAEWAYDSACCAYTFTHTLAKLLEACMCMRLSEPMTLHVVPIRSRTRLRPACVCDCMSLWLCMLCLYVHAYACKATWGLYVLVYVCVCMRTYACFYWPSTSKWPIQVWIDMHRHYRCSRLDNCTYTRQNCMSNGWNVCNSDLDYLRMTSLKWMRGLCVYAELPIVDLGHVK
jgi:hypothetical protein